MFSATREASGEFTNGSFDWQGSFLPGYQPGGARSQASQHASESEPSLDESLNSSSLTFFSKLDLSRRERVVEDTSVSVYFLFGW